MLSFRVAVIGIVAALAVPAGAAASPRIQYGIQDDAWLQSGELEQRLGTLDRLGVDVVRYTLNWREIARRRPAHATDPDDPAYQWRTADAVLRGLRAHRIAVVVTLASSPAWANGGHGQNWIPRSKWALASFAVAAAKRYPWLRMWEIWNEPNLRRFLRPNSARLYVQRLLNPTYAALHHVRRGVRVAGGATSPRATPSGLSPIAFMRGMRAAHARLDAYAHHPYPVHPRETPYRLVCRHCTVLTMATLPRLVAEVKRDFGHKRIWLTEYGYQTNPPDRTTGVSPRVQARRIGEAAVRALRTPYVDLLIHFLVRDEAAVSRWQSGLIFADGVFKPAFDAFALPLAQVSRRRTRTVLWGQVRPRRGVQRYLLQRLSRGRWIGVGGLARTNARGSYTRVVRAGRGARFRIYSPADKAYSAVITVR